MIPAVIVLLPVPGAGVLSSVLLRVYSPSGVSTTPTPVAPPSTTSSLYTVTVTPPPVSSLDTPEVVELTPKVSAANADGFLEKD